MSENQDGRVFEIEGPGEESWLYVLQCDGRVKIGRSTDPKGRIADLQIGSARRLDLVALVPERVCSEKEAHNRFGSYRVHGEWFEYGEELRAWVKALAGNTGYGVPPRTSAHELVRVGAHRPSSELFSQLKVMAAAGALVPAAWVLKMLDEPEEATVSMVTPTPVTWREKLWTCPPDTRIGVVELAEALGRPKSFIYRRTGPAAEGGERRHAGAWRASSFSSSPRCASGCDERRRKFMIFQMFGQNGE